MKLLISLFLSLLTLANVADASIHPQPCGWGLQGELLIFEPSSSETQFFTNEGGVDAGTFRQRANNTRFKPGFRLEGVYAYDCLHDFHVRFTYFNQSYRRSITGPQVAPFASDFTTSNLNYRFWAIEALWGRWLYNCCDFNLCFQFGLEYANIRHSHRINYTLGGTTPISTLVRDRNWFSGIGPEIVFDFQYPFPNCCLGNFAIAGYARGALLAARDKVQRTTSIASLSVASDSIYYVTPTTDMRLGLNWTRQCGCFNALVEVGYEWIWFRKGTRFIPVFFNTSAMNGFADVDFQGPYVAVGVAF